MEIIDSVLPENILDGLETRVFGKNILFFDKIDSTNLEAKRMAKKDAVCTSASCASADANVASRSSVCTSTSCASHGTLLIAEEQGKGRGRLERYFYTPKGMGLWFSIILRPKFKITDASKCTLLAAVAVALAMEEIELKPEIKWPNDIMHGNKKLTGILTELVIHDDNSYSVIIGTGINVNFLESDFPENIRETATSLRIIKGEKVERAKFLQRVLFFMEDLYNKAIQDGFGEVFNLWRKFSVTLNKNIRVINAGDSGEIIGRAVDIDEDGVLLVETSYGLIKVLAGDVSIRERNIK